MASSLPAASSPPAQAQAKALYDRAVEFEARGNPGAALSLLWEAAGLAPTDGEIQNRLGAALERIGALDAAVEAYRVAVSASPAPPAAPRNLVLALVKVGRSPEAIDLARRWIAGNDRDADRWFTLGLAQADVDFESAVDSLRQALTLDDRHALARYNLALVLFHADHLTESLAELDRALAVQPRSEIHYTRGVVYWRQGHLDRAVGALDASIEMDASNADAHLALGSVLKARGDLTRAASSLRRAIALRPDLPAPHIVLAQTLSLAGDEAGARRESKEAEQLRLVTAQSQEAAALTAVGVQKLDEGDAAGAADCFRRATKVFDRFAPAHYHLGRALDRLGRHDAARAAYKRATQLNPALVAPR